MRVPTRNSRRRAGRPTVARRAGPVPDNPSGQQPATSGVPDRRTRRRGPGLSVDIDDRLAEYDRGLSHYVPIEQVRTEHPEEWARMAAGHLARHRRRGRVPRLVAAALADIVAVAEHDDTVAVFSHGGVINVVPHELLGTARLLSFPIDYVSVTRLLYARSGQGTVAAVNSTEHVWDLLPRNRR